jgi:hypothetical protein
MRPDAWSATATPVYVHIGTPASRAIVAEYGLVGDAGGYALYLQFARR